MQGTNPEERGEQLYFHGDIQCDRLGEKDDAGL